MFSFDINAANNGVNTKWKSELKVPQDFNLNDLSLDSWEEFYANLPSDCKLVNLYTSAVVRNNPVVTCNAGCQENLVASVSQTEFCDNQLGAKQAQRFNQSCNNP